MRICRVALTSRGAQALDSLTQSHTGAGKIATAVQAARARHTYTIRVTYRDQGRAGRTLVNRERVAAPGAPAASAAL